MGLPLWGFLEAQFGALWGHLGGNEGPFGDTWGAVRGFLGTLRVDRAVLWSCHCGVFWEHSLGLLRAALGTQPHRVPAQVTPQDLSPSQPRSVQPSAEPGNGGNPSQIPHKSLTNLSPGFFPVPIVPTFLYTTEYEGANGANAPASSALPEPTPAAPRAPLFSSVFSYFDNTTVPVRGFTGELLNGKGSSPPGNPPNTPQTPPKTPQTPPNTSQSPARGCLQGGEFLAQENTRVGLLFASKALVQLLLNPWVGVLTNR